MAEDAPSPRPAQFAALSDPVRVALMFGALFFGVGLTTPYLPVWLAARGLSVGEIGLVTVLPLFVRLLAAPVIGFQADRHHVHRELTIGLCLLAVFAWLLLAATTGFAAALIALAVVALANGNGPLVESIAMTGVRRHGHDYGRMRLGGTATFVVANLVGGWCIAQFGGGIVIWLIVAAAVAAFGAALLLPATVRDETRQLRPLSWADARALLAIPRLRRLLLASGAVQGAHGMFYTFGTLHWQAQGLDPRWFGALWSLGLVTEVAIFWWSRALVARLGASGVFLCGAGLSVLRWGVLGFDPPLAVLVPLQMLHGITYGASHLGTMHRLVDIVPADRTATAQALYALSSIIGIIAATTVASRLYPQFGGSTYFAMALMAAVGLVAVLPSASRWMR